MRFRRKHSLAVFVAVFFALAGLICQDRGLEVKVKELSGQYAQAGKQYAVFIAVNKYRYWLPLKNPVKDAREIKAILEDRYFIDEVIELYDDQATKTGIFMLFDNLIKTVKPDDSVFIYYAGHGHVDTLTDTGFWIPVDSGMDKFNQENWIPNIQIRNLIGKMKARHVALVSDSCFSGDILNPNRAASPEINQDYFKNAYSRVSRQVLTSGASETVPDDSEFSRQFKLALEGNSNPYLDPLMLYSDIRLGMRQTTPLFGDLKDSGHQTGASFLFFLRDGMTEGASKASRAETEKAARQTAPSRKPSLVVEKAYGAATIEVKASGSLYLNDEFMGDLKPGRQASLTDLEAGEVLLKMSYEDGNTETIVVEIVEDQAVPVVFGYTEDLASDEYVEPSEGETVEEEAAVSESEATEASYAASEYEMTDEEAQASEGEAEEGNDDAYESEAVVDAVYTIPESIVFVAGGLFSMGDGRGEGKENEVPVHSVSLSDFVIGQYEVTIGEFREFVESTGYFTEADATGGGWILSDDGWERRSDVNWSNSSLQQSDEDPVVMVSWMDCIEYCNWRSVKEGLDPCYTIEGGEVSCDFSRGGYRLPTEAEWEYAALGGKASVGWRYSGSDDADPVAWYGGNSEGSTNRVGTKYPNELGIFDMSGNVSEWCWDLYVEYGETTESNPAGSFFGDYRVFRGGCWDDDAQALRPSCRFFVSPNTMNCYLGFRVARR